MRLMNADSVRADDVDAEAEQLAKVGARCLEPRSPRADAPQHDHGHNAENDLLCYKRPGPEAGNGRRHAHDSAGEDGNQAPQGQAAEGHLAPEQSHLDAAERRFEERQR